MNQYLAWHEDEKQLLKKMVEAGKGPREIQLVLKSRTSEAIRTYALRLGLSFARREVAEIDREEYARLMKGKS